MTNQAYTNSGYGLAAIPHFAVRSPRNPTTTDLVNPGGSPYNIGDLWQNTLTSSIYEFIGGASVWGLNSTSSGLVDTLSGDTGTANPSGGNIQLAGTANQITTAASGSTITLSLPAAITLPGSLVVTTTLTVNGSGTYSIGTSNTATTLNLANGTGGNTISINNGVNTAANITNINAGASAFANTVNILSGNATSGTQTLNLATGTGGKTVHFADGAGINSLTIGSTNTTSGTTIQSGSTGLNLTSTGTTTITGTTVASTSPYTITLGAVATTGLAITTAAGSGVGETITTSAATVDALQLITGSIKVPAPSVAGGTPVVNNVRTGQVSFTDSIANGAFGTLTMTNSIIGSGSIILAVASCATVNSAVSIVGIVPGSGTVAFRLLNAGSASTAVNILINFWVLN